MSRFVTPETTVLALANGDTLVVKKRLNRGERAEMYARTQVSTDAGPVIDRTKLGLSRVAAYLIDWQLQDASTPLAGLDWDGKAAVLNSLDPDDFDEILEAVDAHAEKIQAERDAAKKLKGGATLLPAISPSPSSSAGATSGSGS